MRLRPRPGQGSGSVAVGQWGAAQDHLASLPLPLTCFLGVLLAPGVPGPLLPCPQLLQTCWGSVHARELLRRVPGESMGWRDLGAGVRVVGDGRSLFPRGAGPALRVDPLTRPAASLSTPGTPFQLKPAGTLCRQAAGDCDLPEFCNGTSPDCPRDTHLLDGSPCASGHGYCWDGACPTLEQQCQQLWGAGETVRAEPGDPLGSAQLSTRSGGELGGGGRIGKRRWARIKMQDGQEMAVGALNRAVPGARLVWPPGLLFARSGSSPALLACFHTVNSAGDARGNCGRSGSGGFTPCEQRCERRKPREETLGS